MHIDNISQLITLLERALNSKSKKLTKQDEYVFFSPFVNHYKPKLQINVKTGKWHCWVSNTGGHNLFQLFKKVGVSKTYFVELNDIGYTTSYKSKSYGKESTETIEKISLPREFIPLYRKNNTPEYRNAMIYLKKRNITYRDIMKYGIGYCEGGEYRNRIIIPSYTEDIQLNYFVGRDIYDSKLKYKNPPISKNIIGFDLFINWELPIVLCEGVFDAIAIKRNAIPLFGKSIPKILMEKIIKQRVKIIYLCLDNDAMDDSFKLSKELMDEGIDVRCINLPNDEDPSSIGFKKFMEFFDKSFSMTFKDLMKFKLGVPI